MLLRVGTAILAGCLVATASLAQAGGPAQAALSSPARNAGAVIVNDLPWRCDGQTCTGPAGPGRFDDARSCRDLAQKVGAVASFHSGRGDLAEPDLARCNKYARKS